MKLIFLGSGSAFTVGEKNYHSNQLLVDDQGHSLLIDCGGDARHALQELELGYDAITHVYISHLHADHTGGLEWLGFTTFFDAACAKPHLFINAILAEKLWVHVLSGGMSSIQGHSAALDTYFDVEQIPFGGSFAWSDITFHLIQTVHYMEGNSLALSFGLFFGICGQQVFMTTDTQFVPHLMMVYYQKADIIFHDCQTTASTGGIHAHYQELLTLPPEIREKMWLYHYNAGDRPDALADGFCGFVEKGQVFTFS